MPRVDYFDDTDRLLRRIDPPAVVNHALERLETRIPEAVRSWYVRADALEVLRTCSNGDHPVATGEMTIVAESGRQLVTFLHENQGACRWAFELEGDDPEVFVAHEAKRWTSTQCTFSQFIWCQVFDWEESWSEDSRAMSGDPPDAAALAFLRSRFQERQSNFLWGSAIVRRFESERVRIRVRPSWVDGDSRVDWAVSALTFADMDEMLEVLAPFYDEEM